MGKHKKGTGDWRSHVAPGQERRAGDRSNQPSGSSVPATEAAFDQWLREKLTILYGPVADEPIPDDLLKLLATFKQEKKDQKKD